MKTQIVANFEEMNNYSMFNAQCSIFERVKGVKDENSWNLRDA